MKVKKIHSYYGNGKIEFVIFKKSIFRWNKSNHSHNSYNTYESAEEDILKWFSRGQGGIIKVDGNIYELFPLSLPTP